MRIFTRWFSVAVLLAVGMGPATLTASAARSPRKPGSSSASTSTAKSSKHKKSRKSSRSTKMRLPKAPTPDRISEIQSALSRGGYYDGEPTGKWDSKTVSALQNFQSANNLDVSGKIDAPSLQKLGLGSDIAGVSAPKTVAPGPSGALVPISQAPPSSRSVAAAHTSASSAAASTAPHSSLAGDAAPSSTGAAADLHR